VKHFIGDMVSHVRVNRTFSIFGLLCVLISVSLFISCGKDSQTHAPEITLDAVHTVKSDSETVNKNQKSSEISEISKVQTLRRNPPEKTGKPAEVTAKITGIKGKVYVRRKGVNYQVTKAGTLLFNSDIIVTGQKSRCDFEFIGLGVAKINADSEIALDQIAKNKNSSVRLGRGQVMCVLQKLSADKQFSVSTPVIVAGVRGTSFSVGYDRSASSSQIAVLTGSVAAKDFQDKEVIIPAKQTAKAGAQGADEPEQISAAVLTQIKSITEIKGVEKMSDYADMKKNIKALELDHKAGIGVAGAHRELAGAASDAAEFAGGASLDVTNKEQLRGGSSVKKDPGFNQEESLLIEE